MTESSHILAIRVFEQLFKEHPVQIALLDLKGVILAVNERWHTFGRENGLDPTFDFVGISYLDVCQKAAEAGDELAAIAMTGLLDVMTTGRVNYAMTYPCHSPDEKRWFKLWIQTQSPANPTIIVVHHLVRSESDLTSFVVFPKWDQ